MITCGIAFGELFKERRRKLGLSLREFCRAHNLDAGNMSKIERGVLPPPENRERLEEYAHMLKLKKGSDEWLAFFDLAAAARGRIPDKLMENESVVRALPLMYRTLRKAKNNDEQLKKFIKLVEGAWRSGDSKP